MSALSSSSWMTPNRGDQSVHWRAGLPSRETWAGWRNGPAGISRNSTRTNATSCAWEGRVLCKDTTGADLALSRLCALEATVAKSNQGCTDRSTARRSERVTKPLHSAVVRPHLQSCVQFCSPQIDKRGWSAGVSSVEGPQAGQGLERFPGRRGWGSCSCPAWGRDGFRGIQQEPPLIIYRDVIEEAGPGSSLTETQGRRMRENRWWRWWKRRVSDWIYGKSSFPGGQSDGRTAALGGCAVSILGGFQETTASSPEQSDLTSELSLLWADVRLATSWGFFQPESPCDHVNLW